MKKAFTLFIISTLLLGTACGSTGNPQAQTAETQESQQVEETETEEMDPTKALLEEGKDYYYARNGQELDYKNAMELFQQAADAGSAEGWYYVGKTYLTDDFRFVDNTDYSKSTEAFEKALELGYPLAGVALGDVYCFGQGTMVDFSKAKEYYKNAVETGCKEGNTGLAYMCWNGYGMEQDADKAKEFALSATEGEDPGYVVSAYDTLALMEEYGDSYANGMVYDYDNEEGRDVDYAAVIDYLEKANDLCTWDGAYLAYLQSDYEKSGDTEKAEEYKNQFLAWCDEAANSDNPRYLCFAGDVYGSARYMDQDDTKRFDYYMKAADAGDADAMHEVGVMYGDGVGTEPSFEIASEWIQKSADCGDTEAMNDLGFLYFNGYGVEQDPSIAMDYYTKAADLGNTEAMENIANAYLYGNGVEQDLELAVEWYQKAMEYGSLDAMAQLAIIYRDVQNNPELACHTFEKAADLGNYQALMGMGYAYENGVGKQQFLTKALEYYEKALKVAEMEKRDDWVERAKQKIEELDNKRGDASGNKEEAGSQSEGQQPTVGKEEQVQQVDPVPVEEPVEEGTGGAWTNAAGWDD